MAFVHIMHPPEPHIVPKKVKIGFNDDLVPVKNFQQYVDLYVGSKTETKRIYESTDERWEYAIANASSYALQARVAAALRGEQKPKLIYTIRDVSAVQITCVDTW